MFQLGSLEESVPHGVLLQGLPLVPCQCCPGEGVVDGRNHPAMGVDNRREVAVIRVVQAQLKL